MTGDGSSVPEEQADPVETAIPFRSRLMSNPSPSIKRNEIFERCGRRNQSKVHIFNRRIHHGEIGTLLGLSNLCTKYPIPAGILAGIGSGLVKDDHDDMKEWFTFKKKK